MGKLHRLVYTSLRKPECTENEIEKILASGKKNNPGRGVTGVLLHSKSRFIQYIEGTKEDIQELYNLIKTDPRHASINLRDFQKIEERVFPSWEMGYKDLSAESRIHFESDVKEKDKKTFEEILGGEIEFNDQGLRLLKLFFQL